MLFLFLFAGLTDRTYLFQLFSHKPPRIIIITIQVSLDGVSNYQIKTRNRSKIKIINLEKRGNRISHWLIKNLDTLLCCFKLEYSNFPTNMLDPNQIIGTYILLKNYLVIILLSIVLSRKIPELNRPESNINNL